MRPIATASTLLAVAAGFFLGLTSVSDSGASAVADSPATLGAQTRHINVHFRQFGLSAPQAACSVLLSNSAQAYAEISLPDAVTLTGLRFDGSNNDQDVNTNFVYLERLEIATCTVSVVATIAMDEFFTNSFRAVSLSHVVDNANYHYRIRLLVPSVGSMTIKRIRLDYDAPGGSVAACPGDNNGDNLVNGSDLSVLLANFGGGCS